MDAEVVIDINAHKNVSSLPTVLTHFLRVDETNPVDGVLYFVLSKILCTFEGLDVRPHPSGDLYHFVIDTEVVSWGHFEGFLRRLTVWLSCTCSHSTECINPFVHQFLWLAW